MPPAIGRRARDHALAMLFVVSPSPRPVALGVGNRCAISSRAALPRCRSRRSRSSGRARRGGRARRRRSRASRGRGRGRWSRQRRSARRRVVRKRGAPARGPPRSAAGRHGPGSAARRSSRSRRVARGGSWSWTVRSRVDLGLADRVCLVTGSTAGIGLETRRAARRRGRDGRRVARATRPAPARRAVAPISPSRAGQSASSRAASRRSAGSMCS